MNAPIHRLQSACRPARDRRAASTIWCHTIGCLLTLVCGILVAPRAPEAQPGGHIPVVGVLRPGDPTFDADPKIGLNAFRQGLRELDYVEGQTIALEVRWAENHPERWPDLAADLVRLPVDIIVAGDTAAALAAKHATSTIPIVMAVSFDPVRDGLVSSLAQPGRNITGLSIMVPELAGKRLELLREAVPGLARVALLLDAGPPNWHAQLHDHEAATQGHAQALIMVQSPPFTTHRARLAGLALASRLPTMSGESGYAKAGGLMNYGPNLPESWHRAATYVDKILKGTKPADLPVEQPRTFELIINLKTAKALGITMPPSLLLLADEVIQ